MRYILLLSVLLTPSLSHAGICEPLAAGIIALYAGSPSPSPTPTPTPNPSPSDVCENCHGTGKVGDGTISVTCAVCNGTGKKTVPTTTSDCADGSCRVPSSSTIRRGIFGLRRG